jgi:ABC-type phosphate transport system substrate-binding protein
MPCYKATGQQYDSTRPVIIVRFLYCWLFGLTLIISPPAAIAGVIVNPSVEGRGITTSSLRNIYTLRQTVWPNRQPIVIFVLPDDNPAHEAFTKEKLGLYPYRLRQIWDRLSFSGMANIPIEVQDENEMRARVRSTPGAIGYSSKDTTHDGIKTLTLE